ncbi:MAG: DUF1194 domain-containing protein [Pseudoruegeria sp.]
MVKRTKSVVLLGATFFLTCAQAAFPAPLCRQALALGLDVSGSVDQAEYQLQIQGLAKALIDPAVSDALLQMPDAPVSLLVFEWSGSNYQSDITGWRSITTLDDIYQLSTQLSTQDKRPTSGTTGIGAAMRAAGGYFQQVPNCWRHTLDLSGDGQNNDWPAPETERQTASLSRVTINGLVIGTDQRTGTKTLSADFGSLVRYYQSQVIKGPDAFVEIALGFEDYQAAMTRKLLRELEVIVLGQASPLFIKGSLKMTSARSINIPNLITPVPLYPPQ